MEINLPNGQYRGIIEVINDGLLVIKMGKKKVEYSEQKFNSQVEENAQIGQWVVFIVKNREIIKAGFSNEKLRMRL